jgi:drug/metabolite transporter (DMT)-like permease
MPVPGGRRYLPSTAVFLTELSKLSVCLTIALYEIATTVPRSTPATSLFGALISAVFTGDSWKMAIPASLYTLANSLQYVGISNLDAATFQVTYQLKIIVTAIFSVTILRKSLSPRKWTALILLMVGVAIVSIPHSKTGGLEPSGPSRIYLPRSLDSLREHFLDVANTPLAKRSATYEGIAEDEMALSHPRVSASIGLLSVIGVCICSGLAGVYFEKVIKEAPKVTSLWVRNVQLSVYSLVPALFIGVVFLDGETVARYGFLDGYNWIVASSILLQAFGGIVAAFCIFYADNISKNFATSISMVLSSLASFFFFDFEATGNVSQTESICCIIY